MKRDSRLALQFFRKGTSLQYEFYREAPDDSSAPDESSDAGQARGLRTIDISRLDQFSETPHEILQRLVAHYHVPEKERCALWACCTFSIPIRSGFC